MASLLAGLFEVCLIFSTPKVLVDSCATDSCSEKSDSVSSGTVYHDLLPESEKELGENPRVSAPAKEVPALKVFKMVGVLAMVFFLFFCTCILPPVRLGPTAPSCPSCNYVFCKPRNSI